MQIRGCGNARSAPLCGQATTDACLNGSPPGRRRDDLVYEAEMAAAAFLARYKGRTLDLHGYDLRVFFQWAADNCLDILKATRPQIDLHVRAMEIRGWPPPTSTAGCRRAVDRAHRRRRIARVLRHGHTPRWEDGPRVASDIAAFIERLGHA